MQTVSSIQNPVVKTVVSLHRKKNRQETGMFIIEGYKGVEDAINYGVKITHIFLSESAKEKARNFSGDTLYLVNEKVLKKISTTDSPCEVLAVAKQLNYSLHDLIQNKAPLIAVLEDIKDPGNLGTIIRTAKAAGVSGIILTGEPSDIYNPKTVRSSAGNLWKIPVIYFGQKQGLKQELLKYCKFQFISTAVAGINAKNHFEADYKPATVIFFGSEAGGLSCELTDQSDFSVKIPMHKEVESLNLSVSAGIILYEAFSQRSFEIST